MVILVLVWGCVVVGSGIIEMMISWPVICNSLRMVAAAYKVYKPWWPISMKFRTQNLGSSVQMVGPKDDWFSRWVQTEIAHPMPGPETCWVVDVVSMFLAIFMYHHLSSWLPKAMCLRLQNLWSRDSTSDLEARRHITPARHWSGRAFVCAMMDQALEDHPTQ